MIKTRYLVIVFLIFSSNLLLAQVPKYGGGADYVDLSFGFSFSYVDSYYKITKKPDWRSPFLDKDNNFLPVTGLLNSINSANSPGFAVGFITRYRISEHLEARINPSIVFADRTLTYDYVTPVDPIDKSVQTTTLDFPLSLKLKSDRLQDFRAYILGGIKYSGSIGAKKNSDANAALLEKTVKNVSGYASYEAGIGCEIYFEYFKLSPEIKISNSINNVLLSENQPFSSPISKLSLHTVLFSLIFE